MAAIPCNSTQSAPPPGEKVGLLFVHGIGQHQRWDHLRTSVVEVAELLASHCADRASVSVVDRIRDWPHAAGEPNIASGAPVTISLRDQGAGGCSIDFECHEVWWADLGKRRGLTESFSFWTWGLGQWGAPIYLDLDASRLTLEPTRARPTVRMPVSIALEPLVQHRARLNLAWAAIGAALAALSISLFKRVAKFVADASPSSTIIVDYIGDVQTYQERERLGRGPVSDPGHPWRVAIRRRMVSEMVAMGARGYDRWYVFAHSLGSVVAFNGLTEIGHTLPNYLPRALWDSLPDTLKRDPQCARRHDLEAMMPSRPAWLVEEDCIDRPLLFEKLRGFVTYGSPLDKFAALWPRIVAAERYGGTAPPPQDKRKQVFKQAEWLNILSETDPVAGNIDRYDPDQMGLEKTDLPRLTNVRRPRPQLFGLSHVRYFQVKDRCEKGDYKDFYDKLFKWLTAEKVPQVDSDEPWDPDAPWGRFASSADRSVAVFLQAFVAFAIIWGLATLFLGLVLLAGLPDDWIAYLSGGAKGAPGEAVLAAGAKRAAGEQVRDTLAFFGAVGLGAIGLATCVVYLCGALRWLGETLYNRRLAEHDIQFTAAPDPKRERLQRFLSHAKWQAAAASFFLFIIPMIVFALLWWLTERGPLPAWQLLLLSWLLSALSMGLASLLQAKLSHWISRRSPAGP